MFLIIHYLQAQLKNVVILANFSVHQLKMSTPDFPYTGTWYDLMDGTGSTSINVTSTTDQISIPAGGFQNIWKSKFNCFRHK